MSRDLTKPTKWVCAQRRLWSAQSVWSVFAVRKKKAGVRSYPLSAQRRLCSDWAHTHFVGFVMSWLSYHPFPLIYAVDLLWLVSKTLEITSLWNAFEPRHDKTNKMAVRPVKIQINLGIRPVWSESSLSAWRKLGSLVTHWAHSEDSDQTGRMPRLIWVFAARTITLLVLSYRGSLITVGQLYQDQLILKRQALTRT